MNEEEAERLNSGAYLALQGLSDSPERDLADLLRADCDIAPAVRDSLAAALEGRPDYDGISLRAEGQSRSEGNVAVRKWKRRAQETRRGREAIRSSRESGYPEDKTAQANMTLARKADAWIEKQLSGTGSNFGSTLTAQALEALFCVAYAEQRDPDDILADTEIRLASLHSARVSRAEPPKVA